MDMTEETQMRSDRGSTNDLGRAYPNLNRLSIVPRNRRFIQSHGSSVWGMVLWLAIFGAGVAILLMLHIIMLSEGRDRTARELLAVVLLGLGQLFYLKRMRAVFADLDLAVSHLNSKEAIEHE